MITSTFFRVVDIETTGFDPEVDRVCEIGWADVVFNPPSDSFELVGLHGSMVCNPGIPIPPTARAVHHISDAMVAGAQAAETAIATFMHSISASTYAVALVAHNAAFESKFLGGSPWICTMRLAKHLWPEAPAYGNQVLRYWRQVGLDAPGLPHRAEHDAIVTAHLLCELLNELVQVKRWRNCSAADVAAFAEEPVVLKGKVGFGKHHDLSWPEVPAGYLHWILSQPESEWEKDVWHTAKFYTGRLV